MIRVLFHSRVFCDLGQNTRSHSPRYAIARRYAATRGVMSPHIRQRAMKARQARRFWSSVARRQLLPRHFFIALRIEL